jgi:hypothetical protein
MTATVITVPADFDANRVPVRADVADHPGYVAGRWYTLFGLGNVANSTTPLVDTAVFSFGFLKERVTIDQLGIRVPTASATGSLRLAIYRADPATNMPGLLVANTGTLSMAAAATVNANLAQGPVTLEPGNYWFGLNGSHGSGAYLALANGRSFLASVIGGKTAALPSNAPMTCFTLTQTFGTWPAEYVTGTAFTENTTNRAPACQFRVSSVP